MTAMEIVSFAALTLSGLGVVIASLSLRHNRNVVRTQIMDHLMSEYRHPDMLAALTRLHRFCDQCERTGKDIKSAYDAEFDSDERQCATLDYKEASKFSAGTLHNHRRLVSHFYNKLYWLIIHGAIPASLVFSYWNRGDLDRLFNKILIPIRRDPIHWLRGLYALSVAHEADDSRSLKRLAIVFLVIWAVFTLGMASAWMLGIL